MKVQGRQCQRDPGTIGLQQKGAVEHLPGGIMTALALQQRGQCRVARLVTGKQRHIPLKRRNRWLGVPELLLQRRDALEQVGIAGIKFEKPLQGRQRFLAVALKRLNVRQHLQRPRIVRVEFSPHLGDRPSLRRLVRDQVVAQFGGKLVAFRQLVDVVKRRTHGVRGLRCLIVAQQRKPQLGLGKRERGVGRRGSAQMLDGSAMIRVDDQRLPGTAVRFDCSAVSGQPILQGKVVDLVTRRDLERLLKVHGHRINQPKQVGTFVALLAHQRTGVNPMHGHGGKVGLA